MSNPDGECPAVRLADVSVWTPERIMLLRDIAWTIGRGEHWALLGPNGSGKSTLLSVVGASRHPSAGTVEVLGSRFGETDLALLRRRIGTVDATQKVYGWLTAEEVALTGLTATIRPLWDRYGTAERERARTMLALVGCAELAERQVGTCSQGERQRVRIARALMNDPELLLLDEPAIGLDLPAREALIAAIVALVAAQPALTTVLVTHHLEELPPTTSHGLLLRSGAALTRGPVRDVLTGDLVSACFGFAVEVDERGGRWAARSSGGWRRAGAPGPAAMAAGRADDAEADEGF